MSISDKLKVEILMGELQSLEIEDYRLQIRHRAAKKINDEQRMALIVQALEKIETERDVLKEELSKLNPGGQDAS